MTAPVNDNIADAVDLGTSYAPAGVAVDTVDATIETGEDTYLTGETQTVWYSWTVPTPAPLLAYVGLSGAMTGADQRVKVFTGTSFAGGLTLVGETVTAGGTGPPLEFSPTAGERYLLAVMPASGATAGPSDLAVTTTGPPGDAWADPIAITAVSGTLAYDATGTTRETGEPVDSTGDNTAGTLWFSYTTGTVGGVLTLSSSGGTNQIVELYDSDPLADIDLLAGSDPNAEISVVVAAGTTYLIRVHAVNDSDTGPATLNYAYAERVQNMSVIIDADLQVTPGLLAVRVSQGDPGQAINFNLVGYGSNPLLVETLDVTGQLTVSVPIPASAVGAYTLEAVTLTHTGTATFNVLTAPPTDPAVPPPVPPDPPPVMAIQRWYLQDPVPGGTASYVFPNNPASMTSPHPDRTLTPASTVAQSGQDLIWEGAARPHSWQFAGYAGTREFQEVLLSYVTLNRRFYLTDHRKRSWEVSFEGLDITQRNDPGNPWAVDYTITAYVYSGPVQQP